MANLILSDQLPALITALISSVNRSRFQGRAVITYDFLQLSSSSNSTSPVYNAADYTAHQASDNGSATLNAARNSAAFVPFTPADEQVVAQVMDEIGRMLGVSFVRSNTLTQGADIRFGLTRAYDGGFVMPPVAGQATWTNDVFLGNTFSGQMNTPKGRAYLLHEIGHALGLKHSFFEKVGDKFLPELYNSTLFTQMAYKDTPLGDANSVFPVSFHRDMLSAQGHVVRSCNIASGRLYCSYHVPSPAP